MRPIRLCFLTVASACVLFGQAPAPELVKRVEPQYAIAGNSVIDPARIVMQLLNGAPVSIRSLTPLPDTVVRALAEWRFKSTGLTAAIEVALGIRRPVESYLFSTNRPESLDTASTGSAAQHLPQLTADQAFDLDRKLKGDETRIAERAALMIFGASRNDAAGHAIQNRQIQWFIAHEPGASVLSSDSALPFDAADAAQITGQWLERVRQSPNDGAVLGHATWFLQFNAPVQAEELLLAAAPKVGGAAAWLGELYAVGALGQKHPNEAADQVAATAFGAHARQILRLTSDARVVLAASAAVSGAGKSFALRGKLPAGFREFCAGVVSRAKALDPASQDTCDFTQAPAGNNYQRTVKPAAVVRKAIPSYPPGAKALRIEGTVTFNATIEKDGSVGNLELLKGALVLYEESRNAVGKWRYSPTAIDGEPVAVSTRIDLNYTLSRR